MDSNGDMARRIQNLIEKLDKLPEGQGPYPTVYDPSNVERINSIKTSLKMIIERAYANSSMKNGLLNELDGIKIRTEHWSHQEGDATVFEYFVVPKDFNDVKTRLMDFMHDMRCDLSGSVPPKEDSGHPFVSNLIINQQTTTIDIIGLLEKAVESEPVPEVQKKNARRVLTDLKNDPVLSQLIAGGIIQLAPKAMEWIAGLPGK